MVKILLQLSIDSCDECPKCDLFRCTINNRLVTLSFIGHPSVPDWCPAKLSNNSPLIQYSNMVIEPGQIWKLNENFYHIPAQDRISPPYHVIRCTKHAAGWRWVFPRTSEDEPFWELKDFQQAELVHRR